jgi:signal transduction histidine kinase
VDIERTARGTVVIAVTDDGEGIPAQALPRIFERFYRADSARARHVGGTGLGLAIVKHLVNAMGGQVSAESELGRGTTIRVVLPAA